MGKRTVQVSGELWQQMCTAGWEVGASSSRSRYGLRCTEGLLEGATFHSAFYIPSVCLGIHILAFIFEHPDWPEVEQGQGLPAIEIVWEETYDDTGL